MPTMKEPFGPWEIELATTKDGEPVRYIYALNEDGTRSREGKMKQQTERQHIVDLMKSLGGPGPVETEDSPDGQITYFYKLDSNGNRRLDAPKRSSPAPQSPKPNVPGGKSLT